MPAQQLNDILNNTRKFHAELSRRLSESAREDNRKENLVLEYLSDHEKKLSHALRVLQEEAQAEELDAWFRENNRWKAFSMPSSESFAGMSVDEVLNEVVREHHRVVNLYRNLCDRAPTPAVRNLLQELADIEDHEALVLAQTESEPA